MSTNEPTAIDRRMAIKWLLAAAASLSVMDRLHAGDEAPVPRFEAGGYGLDSNLLKTYTPGEVWPLILTPAQRKAAIALCDVIIPADNVSPSASSVGVHDFINEWVSAPYSWVGSPEASHAEAKKLIIDGLNWIDEESNKRFGTAFCNLISSQQHAICDDICYTATAKKEFKKAATFFAKFRNLTAGGFYTTPIGMKDIGYIGNVPMASFDGPPPEVLKRLGLDQSA
jgi:hypothetical protein